jgi:YD repeat-containing protein
MSTLLGALLIVTFAVIPATSEPRTIYDDQGRVVLEVREDGAIVSYSYDEQGRIVKSDLPDGSKVENHVEREKANPKQ